MDSLTCHSASKALVLDLKSDMGLKRRCASARHGFMHYFVPMTKIKFTLGVIILTGPLVLVSSASFSAEISVRPTRKLVIFII